ncbi:polyprenyl synthetase family protein [Streptomyces sp. NBC_01198]|uniref:polyprenyl synthetase family protein n=1 Tax=Streptomyces sp. NBC_01198 TaxID=2903769 RepID=UPI003FA35549
MDADVAGAVLRTAGVVLGERIAQTAAIDADFSRDLAEGVADFTLSGGRRARPQLLWWTMRACGGGASAADTEAALRLGVAIELIQTCALVHDDVMDRSLLRRGRPAVHIDLANRPGPVPGSVLGEAFGTSAAVLVGDLALAWADDTVADTDMSPAVRRQVQGVWRAMRTEMVAGQYLDLYGQATGTRSAAAAMRTAYLKSALYSVERPLVLGAALAGADQRTTRALSSAGRCAGIAFQLRDDLLGVFGDPAVTGKPSGGDIREGKPTYLLALARARAQESGDRRTRFLLDSAVGCADLSEAALAEVREALTSTGARADVEDRADLLMRHAGRHLAEADVEPGAGHRLLGLLRTIAGAPAVPLPERSTAGSQAAGNNAPIPAEPILTAAAKGGTAR